MWASRRAANLVAAQAVQPDTITLLDLLCRAAREVALGQSGQAYTYGITVSTVVLGGGSLKKGGSKHAWRIRAAIVSLNDRVTAHFLAIILPGGVDLR